MTGFVGVFRFNLVGRVISNNCVHVLGHLLVIHIEVQMAVRTSIHLSSPACMTSDGLLSTAGDLPVPSVFNVVSISVNRV